MVLPVPAKPFQRTIIGSLKNVGLLGDKCAEWERGLRLIPERLIGELTVATHVAIFSSVYLQKTIDNKKKFQLARRRWRGIFVERR